MMFPIEELKDAIADYENKPYDVRRLVHFEAMLAEMLKVVRQEVAYELVKRVPKKD